MIASKRRWNIAFAEHENVVREFLRVCATCAPAEWQCEARPGEWSPAAVALHVSRTYELATEAIGGRANMRPLVSKRVAWLSRTLLLPVILATKWFPEGARSPREVEPDLDEAKRLTQDAAAERVMRGAVGAEDAFRRAAQTRSTTRVTHAYFGPLTPYAAFRLLTAHTRHHGRLLAARRSYETAASSVEKQR